MQQTTPAPAQQAAESKAALLAQAETAHRQGNTVRAEVLYRRVLELSDLSEAERLLAWERFSRAALANGHAHLALEGAERLAKLDPARTNDPAWQDLYLSALASLTAGADASGVAQGRLASLAADTKAPWRLRAEAALYLAGYAWDAADYPKALTQLGLAYGITPEQEAGFAYRARLERELLAKAADLPDTELAGLLADAGDEARLRYPYTVLRLDRARRIAAYEERWPEAYSELRALLAPGLFQSPELVQSVLTPLTEQRGLPYQSVALALPLSGPYGSIGWKILRGAGVAQWGLARLGADISVSVINTEAADFLDQVAALPPSCTLLGGPLRGEKLAELTGAGQHRARALFAFASTLPPEAGELGEGRDLWRFFGSRADQTKALVDLAVHELGVMELASLYPDEPYGRRMADLFAQQAATTNATLVRQSAYPTGKPEELSTVVSDFLDVDPRERGRSTPLPPSPPFGAVYMPDAFSVARMLAPQFFFFGEERQLILGSALWGQGLTRLDALEEKTFRLAVFPGPFDAGREDAAVLGLVQGMADAGLGTPSAWEALGYDFVRFAATLLPLPPGFTAAEVNARLHDLTEPEPSLGARDAGGFSFSQAPLRYDAEGRLSQELFLFQVEDGQAERLNRERLVQRLTRAQKRHQQRIEWILQEREEERLKALGRKLPSSTVLPNQ